MAKKLSDINLQSDRRKAEKMYERSLSGDEGSVEASKQLEKPRFKSFLKDIIDKKNSGVGGGGALVKDPQPDILKEELTKTADKLQEILRLKRSNSKLRSKLEESRRIKPPGDTPTKKRLGLGAVAGAVAAPAVNLLGALKDLIGIALLNWISDPKNFEMVKGVIKTLQALVKFFSAWIGGSISNLFTGWHELTRGGSLAERLGGFFKLMAGFTGLKWLMRPGTIFKDLKLIFNNLKVWPKTLKGLFGKNARQFEQKTIDKFLKNRFGRVFGRGLGRTFGRVFLRIFGTAGKKILRGFIKPLLRRVSGIPLIGPIIAFLVNWGVFKEPPGRAAFKAGAASFGMFLAGAAGSVIPFFGTWVGAALGGIVGDWVGGALYDLFFSGGDGKPKMMASESNEAGNIIQIATKFVKEGFTKAVTAVVDTGKAAVQGVYNAGVTARRWTDKKASQAWNWVKSPFGGGNNDSTDVIVPTPPSSGQVNNLSGEHAINKKTNENMSKTTNIVMLRKTSTKVVATTVDLNTSNKPPIKDEVLARR